MSGVPIPVDGPRCPLAAWRPTASGGCLREVRERCEVASGRDCSSSRFITHSI